MSAASPATSHARRTEATAPARAVRQPAFAFAAPSADDEIRLHLGDIPRPQATLDIEGFKPTLLSRLFDLVAPLNRR